MKCNEIFIIDDEEGIRESLKDLLESEGYSTKLAANGKEAFELLTKQCSCSNPCLILLDLMMPIMNGWEFIQKLNQLPERENIPIAIISAYSELAKDLKVKAVLKKPFQLDTVLSLTKQFCE